MLNIGPQELLILLVVALVIVGPKRLPELGRTIGRGLNEFRKIQDEVKDMVKFDLSEDPMAPSSDPAPYDDLEDEPDHEADPAAADEEGAAKLSHSERVIAAMEDDVATLDPLHVAPEPPDDDPEARSPSTTE